MGFDLKNIGNAFNRGPINPAGKVANIANKVLPKGGDGSSNKPNFPQRAMENIKGGLKDIQNKVAIAAGQVAEKALTATGAGAIIAKPVGFLAKKAVEHPKEATVIIFALLVIYWVFILVWMFLFWIMPIVIISYFASIADAGLSVAKNGPDTVSPGSQISYTITITESSNHLGLVAIDTLPDETTFVDCPGDKCVHHGNIVFWDGRANLDPATLAQIPLQFPPSIPKHTYTFHLVIKPTSNTSSFWAINKVKTFAIPIPFTANQPPNGNTCNGKYDLNAGLGPPLFPVPGVNPQSNFGDPSCNFDKNVMSQLIQEQDPANYYMWFIKIAPCESNYNPNSYNPNSQSGHGAFGLFQMNPKGTHYDDGYVEWRQQISNAINREKWWEALNVGPPFAYWECSR